MFNWEVEVVETHRGRGTLPRAWVGDYPVYNVGSLFRDQENWVRPQNEITGFAVHHDAVAFNGEDKNFSGHTIDESFVRLNAIYNYHIQQKWNGIGYHAVIDLEGRIFIPRSDVIGTHRAHVSSASGNRTVPRVGEPSWNHQLIGVCFMGNYSDGKLPNGNSIGPLQDRPTENQLGALDSFCRYITDELGRPMTLRPHKYYQVKECPGSWVMPDAWGDTYTPTVTPIPIIETPQYKEVIKKVIIDLEKLL